MNKWIISLTAVLVILIGGWYYLFNYGSPIKKQERIELVEAHLTEMGELEEAIQLLTPIYDKKHGDFDISVVFKDETEVEYIYFITTAEKVALQEIRKNNGTKIYEGKHDSVPIEYRGPGDGSYE
ncbi:DUF3139 domain-containing protein [Bacillus litorisediminis]|uniref:DUF3139 domain-containing protein n=1 Tax=Bacillus litorisediminis TaxID=2922713 RepID=UPI001FAD9BEB|nr:DUF3139 domain-containing protein [Bacillus litorisediminis]